MVKSTAAEVETLEECKGCSLHFWLEAKCSRQLLAELLHLELIELAELGLILKRYCAQLLACARNLLLVRIHQLHCNATAPMDRQGLTSDMDEQEGLGNCTWL